MKNRVIVLFAFILFSSYAFCQDLLDLAKNNKSDEVIALIKNGQKDIPNELGWNALIYACQNENTKLVEYLIKTGSDVCTDTMNSGWFPLLIASRYNKSTDIVKMLLKTNAKYLINITGHDGFTPLVAAAKGNNLEICKLLLENGARKNLKTGEGYFVWEYSTVTEVQELLKP